MESNLKSFIRIKPYAIGMFVISCIAGLIFAIKTNTPVGSTYKEMKFMEEDMDALFGDSTLILYRNKTAKSGVASLLVIVNPQESPRQQKREEILHSRNWQRLEGNESTYCKEGAELTFTNSTFKNQSSVSIRMTYENNTVKRCSSIKS